MKGKSGHMAVKRTITSEKLKVGWKKGDGQKQAVTAKKGSKKL